MTTKEDAPLEFDVGDKVFLRTSPVKQVMRFHQKGKLNPRYVRPFKVIGRVAKAAYRLALLFAMTGIHDVFYVSMLKKYITDPRIFYSTQKLKSLPI